MISFLYSLLHYILLPWEFNSYTTFVNSLGEKAKAKMIPFKTGSEEKRQKA